MRIAIAGSIRRKVAEPRDIDILVIPKSIPMIKHSLQRAGEIVASGKSKINVDIEGVRINVVFTVRESWGAALLYFTGPKGANIYNRKLAKSKGLLLNEKGLFDRKTGKRIPAYTEQQIYKALGKTYRRPEDRGKPR